MCSFLLYNFLVKNKELLNYYLRFRGPDKTNEYIHIYNNISYLFIHNLLNITGAITLQPFVKNNIVCLFNGEIYNYKKFGNYTSDGQCIIDLYEKYSDNFCSHLDGEYAIVLIDYSNEKILISTDIFATKPIWYNFNKGHFGISTYRSGLLIPELSEPIKLMANTTLIFSLTTLKLIQEYRVYNFCLTQTISNFTQWEKAFINSIKTRAYDMKYPIFVCLSGGYDSGAICCILNYLNIPYFTYTIPGKENLSIIHKRIDINKKKSCIESLIINISEDQVINHKKYIELNGEQFKFSFSPEKENTLDLINDQASIGMSVICELASKKNQRIYLSGQGADEIISDYAMYGKKIYSNSNFNGIFPEKMEDIFPINPYDKLCKWYSFYNYSQSSYLGKEEIISGIYGIEGRYPFLDKEVVQEFLYIEPSLKNKTYKGPIKYLFEKFNYPYEEEKIGFNLNLETHFVYLTKDNKIASNSTNNFYANKLLKTYKINDNITLKKDKRIIKLKITNKIIKNNNIILFFNNNIADILNNDENRQRWVII